MTAPEHIPVLTAELLSIWQAAEGDRLLDATLGLGGHARAFLEATATGTVFGIDADPAAAQEAKQRLASFGERVTYCIADFNHLKDSVHGGGILDQQGFTHVLFDLGLGSHQLADPKRGFSFASDGPLQMRYRADSDPPASSMKALRDLERRLQRLPDAIDIIRGLSADDLSHLIRVYGEERYARRIAAALKENLQTGTARETADVVRSAVPAFYERGRIDPATRTFQALRIAVNRDLEALSAALPQAFDVLLPGGTLSVISFHSLEDRIVKQFMRAMTAVCICPPEQPQCTCTRSPRAELVARRPIRPSPSEILHNPRARSAKLRALRKR